MFAQDAFDEHAQLSADVFAQRPVNGDVLPHRLNQFAGDGAERLVAQHFHCAVVCLQSVVEGEFLFGKPEFFAVGVCLPHLL